MKGPHKTVGFGAPGDFGAHIFMVEIPAARTSPVTVLEIYGYAGEQQGVPSQEPRVVIARKTWMKIRDTAQREFNRRLKAAKLKTCRWRVGDNPVDRLLGKELCVLAWASEHARKEEELSIICSKWLALRPEERWWLFSQTVAEAGLPEDMKRGWRKALYFALSDGKAVDKARKKRPRPRTKKVYPREKDLFKYLAVRESLDVPESYLGAASIRDKTLPETKKDTKKSKR